MSTASASGKQAVPPGELCYQLSFNMVHDKMGTVFRSLQLHDYRYRMNWIY